MGLLIILAAIPGVGTTGDFMGTIHPTLANLLHSPAYGLFAWLWVSNLRSYGVARFQAVMAAMIIATMYGVVLEVFQTLVPGRDPSLMDCLLNLAGILLFTGCYLMVSSSRIDHLATSRIRQ